MNLEADFNKEETRVADAILMGEPMALFHADEEGALEDVSRFTRSLAGAEVNVGIGLSLIHI